MLKLKIKKKGLVINIPGVPQFRSPAEIDITKLDLKMVINYLKSNSIADYEILSATDTGKIDIYIKEDFDAIENRLKREKDLESRFNKLEKMLSLLINRTTGDAPQDSEQITKKLERLENLIQNIPKSNTTIIHKLTDPKVEKLSDEPDEDAYIPDIDISDMKMSSGSYKEMENKSKKEVDSSADLLAGLLRKK
jgi:hypothetical protein